MAVTLPNGTQITYLVDGQNHRIGKKINGTLVQAFYIRMVCGPSPSWTAVIP
jgi:hypothetical protein